MAREKDALHKGVSSIFQNAELPDDVVMLNCQLIVNADDVDRMGSNVGQIVDDAHVPSPHATERPGNVETEAIVEKPVSSDGNTGKAKRKATKKTKTSARKDSPVKATKQTKKTTKKKKAVTKTAKKPATPPAKEADTEPLLNLPFSDDDSKATGKKVTRKAAKKTSKKASAKKKSTSKKVTKKAKSASVAKTTDSEADSFDIAIESATVAPKKSIAKKKAPKKTAKKVAKKKQTARRPSARRTAPDEFDVATESVAPAKKAAPKRKATAPKKVAKQTTRRTTTALDQPDSSRPVQGKTEDAFDRATEPSVNYADTMPKAVKRANTIDKIDEIKTQMDCPKRFECAEDRFVDMCKAKVSRKGQDVLCKEGRRCNCRYQKPSFWFWKRLCTCRMRQYVARKFGI
jgi:colicin import membrane protein